MQCSLPVKAHALTMLMVCVWCGVGVCVSLCSWCVCVVWACCVCVSLCSWCVCGVVWACVCVCHYAHGVCVWCGRVVCVCHYAHGVCVCGVGVCSVCVCHHASLSCIAALIRCEVVMATGRYQEHYNTQCELLHHAPKGFITYITCQYTVGLHRQRQWFSSPQSCAVSMQHFHIWTSR